MFVCSDHTQLGGLLVRFNVVNHFGKREWWQMCDDSELLCETRPVFDYAVIILSIECGCFCRHERH